MEVVIRTSDPEAVDAVEVKTALEELGYFVLSVTIEDRGTGLRQTHYFAKPGEDRDDPYNLDPAEMGPPVGTSGYEAMIASDPGYYFQMGEAQREKVRMAIAIFSDIEGPEEMDAGAWIALGTLLEAARWIVREEMAR